MFLYQDSTFVTVKVLHVSHSLNSSCHRFTQTLTILFTPDEAAEVNRCFREGLMESPSFTTAQCLEILRLITEIGNYA